MHLAGARALSGVDPVLVRWDRRLAAAALAAGVPVVPGGFSLRAGPNGMPPVVSSGTPARGSSTMWPVDTLIAAGLGLDHDELRLGRTIEAWVAAGAALRDRVEEILGGGAAGVEHIGSSSVAGLLAKPIVDLAVGLRDHGDVAGVRSRLVTAGWIYRGDAGDHGGHVFVLEAHPWHRVAHLHSVEHGGAQWRNYLRLRDLLRASPDARRAYEAEKLRLIEELGADRKAYTEGKSGVVRSLLGPLA